MKSVSSHGEYIVLFLDNGVTMSKKYDEYDPIWDLPDVKQERKCLTDIHREVIKAADALIDDWAVVRR